MGSNGINPLILQNRLISQAKSRTRSQSAGIASALANSGSGDKNKALLDAMKSQAGKNATSDSDLRSKSNYTSMKKAAENLKSYAKDLLSWPEKKWEEMTEEEKAKYRENVVSKMSDFVSDYNSMIKSMTDEGGKVNEIYLSQLKSSFKNAKSDLEELGITRKEDGTLALDKSILGAADVEKIKKALGAEGTFVDDVGKKTESIISNADTNLAVVNKSLYAGNYTYDHNGTDIFDLLASGGKYNFWG